MHGLLSCFSRFNAFTKTFDSKTLTDAQWQLTRVLQSLDKIFNFVQASFRLLARQTKEKGGQLPATELITMLTELNSGIAGFHFHTIKTINKSRIWVKTRIDI